MTLKKAFSVAATTIAIGTAASIFCIKFAQVSMKDPNKATGMLLEALGGAVVKGLNKLAL